MFAVAALLVACTPSSPGSAYPDVPVSSLGSGLQSPGATTATDLSSAGSAGETASGGSGTAQSSRAAARDVLGTLSVVTGTPGAWGEDPWTPRVLTPVELDDNGDPIPPSPGQTAPAPTDPQYENVTALLSELNSWTLTLGDDPGMDEQQARAGYAAAWETARAAGLSVSGVLSPGNVAEGFDAQAPGAWTLVAVSTQAGEYCLADLSLFNFDSLTPEQQEITGMTLPGYALIVQDCSPVSTVLYGS